MADYKQNRSLVRGLAVLEALNREGASSPSQLARVTGLDRTTVRRLIGTLQQCGYVDRGEMEGTFHLNLKVRALSEGFDNSVWLAQAAVPSLLKLLRQINWPTDVATFERDAMVIRETTHRLSPFSIHRAMVGRRLPVLTSAAGRAFFASSTPDRRATILDAVSASQQPDRLLAGDRNYVESILDRTIRDGCATSFGEVEPGMGGVAVPLCVDGQVIGSLNCVFFTSALTVQLAIERHLPALREAAAEIESKLTGSADQYLGGYAAPQQGAS